jgi:hypothetical protein
MSAPRRSRREVEALLADLAVDDAVRRETAVTRLSLIGLPAVEPLAQAAGRGPALSRVAALQALELIGPSHVLEPAAACLRDGDPAVAVGALEVMGRLVQDETRSLDEITAVALDPARDERLRLEALRILAELPRRIVAPIWRKLAGDPSEAVRRRVTTVPAVLPRLDEAGALSLVTSAAVARELVTAQGASAPLPALQQFVEFLRGHEATETDEGRRAEWTAVRGALHQALAVRGSRVALYDLRESIERAGGPLPAPFLAAVSAIGDASCLEGLAAAYVRATGRGPARDDWWRERVREAFREIVRRKRLSTRHPAMRKVASRWPAAESLTGRPRPRQ